MEKRVNAKMKQLGKALGRQNTLRQQRDELLAVLKVIAADADNFYYERGPLSIPEGTANLVFATIAKMEDNPLAQSQEDEDVSKAEFHAWGSPRNA